MIVRGRVSAMVNLEHLEESWTYIYAVPYTWISSIGRPLPRDEKIDAQHSPTSKFTQKGMSSRVMTEMCAPSVLERGGEG